MTKREIVAKIAKQTDCTINEVNSVYEALMQLYADLLADGESVYIQGVGKIETVVRKSRTFSDPRTKEPIKKGPTKRLHFIPSRLFTQWLNERH